MRKNRFYRRMPKAVRYAILGVLIFFGIWMYRSCKADSANKFLIEETPIQVTKIREIAELAVIGMEDEFVLDSVEYYKSKTEKYSGNSFKLQNTRDFKNVISNSEIKRRLTLIVKTKSKIGFDLSENQLQIFQNKDTVWIHTGKPKILSVERNPSKTKVFIENGSWSDSDRIRLLERIPKKIEKRLKENDLNKKVESIFQELLIKLLKDDRQILVYHDL
ncbi:MAG: DUF4230 domain-containing protein [Bacteroidetes bacterium]|nr:DUF4230 domain-containing protein [Bacteroidota bacterium]